MPGSRRSGARYRWPARTGAPGGGEGRGAGDRGVGGGGRGEGGPGSALAASLHELATRPAGIVDRLVELVVVVECLLNALVLESLGFHAPIQRVDRVLLLVE